MEMNRLANLKDAVRRPVAASQRKLIPIPSG